MKNRNVMKEVGTTTVCKELKFMCSLIILMSDELCIK